MYFGFLDEFFTCEKCLINKVNCKGDFIFLSGIFNLIPLVLCSLFPSFGKSDETVCWMADH